MGSLASETTLLSSAQHLLTATGECWRLLACPFLPHERKVLIPQVFLSSQWSSSSEKKAKSGPSDQAVQLPRGETEAKGRAGLSQCPTAPDVTGPHLRTPGPKCQLHPALTLNAWTSSMRVPWEVGIRTQLSKDGSLCSPSSGWVVRVDGGGGLHSYHLYLPY